MNYLTLPTARREIIRLISQSAAGAALGPGILSACVSNPQPGGNSNMPVPVPIPASATGIDVHCHIFNGRDLPIPGFVLHVVLEADPLANAQFGFIVTLLALIIDQGARGADAEIAQLASPNALCGAPGGTSTFRDQVKAAALAMQNPTPDDASKAIIDHAHEVVTKRSYGQLTLNTKQNPTGAASGVNGMTSDAKFRRGQFLQQVADLKAGAVVPGTSPLSQSVPPAAMMLNAASHDDIADAVADGVIKHASNNSGVFYLASLLTRSRAELAIKLAALPNVADRGDIALFTPALIDFSYWLVNDPKTEEPNLTQSPKDVTPLADQIKVMSSIAAKTCNHAGIAGGFAVHPFVSFCPWRQIAEELDDRDLSQQQISLVKDAIINKGFIGVKIYPLMGFRPIGNATIDESNFPSRLRALDDFAHRMDNALIQLYNWCVDNDVPIMAHCSFSQYPSVAGGLIGGPDGWMEVLSRPGLKNLRLNLAHCGGVWDLSAQRIRQISQETDQKLTTPWAKAVLGMLGDPRYPNLYADLADFGDVLQLGSNQLPPVEPEPAGGDQSAVVALVRLMAKNPAARKRLMYGTDYMFLIQSPRSENYLADMRDYLAPGLGIAKSDFMGGNAARFLGLDDSHSGTRTRLDKFRGDTFLARWNQSVS